jgi:hypothetical protein
MALVIEENLSLVPKLCLGMPIGKLCFPALKTFETGKQSFPIDIPKQSLGTRA